MTKTELTVLRFGDRPVPRPLSAFPRVDMGDAMASAAEVGDVVSGVRRVAVIGGEPDLAALLTGLMRTDRLDVEVAHVRGWRSSRRAHSAPAQRVPLIRDDTGTVLIGEALWLPPAGEQILRGEAVVDDTVLFDGDVAGVRIEPMPTMPGLRAAVIRTARRRWVSGRAAQLGTTGARVIRDGVEAQREVRRSTFYRHTSGWLRVDC